MSRGPANPPPPRLSPPAIAPITPMIAAVVAIDPTSIAMSDATTLVLTTIEDGPKGWAKLCRAVGGHCIEDLVQNFRLPDEPEVGVEREEFDAARQRLEHAGFRLRDGDRAWADFSRLRAQYAGRVNSLARYWATPPAQWIGDRSPLRNPRLHREQTRVEVSSGA